MPDPIQQVITQAQERYFGKYRGFVVDNKDPEGRARVTLRIPSVLGDAESHWAEPCLPFGGLADQGMFLVPEIDAQVWVEFEEGNVNRPIWTGTTWQQAGDAPGEANARSPNMRQIKTPSGQILSFDDTEGEEELRLYHPADAELKIDNQGTVQVTDASGAVLTMDAANASIQISDANGNRLTMDVHGTRVTDAAGNEIVMEGGMIKISSGATVTIEGAMVNVGGTGGEPLIKGASFLGLFASHMHVSNVPGTPTSPPIPQGEMSTLSTTCRVK